MIAQLLVAGLCCAGMVAVHMRHSRPRTTDLQAYRRLVGRYGAAHEAKTERIRQSTISIADLSEQIAARRRQTATDYDPSTHKLWDTDECRAARQRSARLQKDIAALAERGTPPPLPPGVPIVRKT